VRHGSSLTQKLIISKTYCWRYSINYSTQKKYAQKSDTLKINRIYKGSYFGPDISLEVVNKADKNSDWLCRINGIWHVAFEVKAPIFWAVCLLNESETRFCSETF
jgi:hypothetical protein